MSEFDGIEVLLAEDSDQDAELTMRALKKCNLNNKLLRVRDGVEAMEFIHCREAYKDRNPHELPRIILLDLKMPRLNGIDVLRSLKNGMKTRMIPVVIMTSSNQERDLEDCYSLGVNGYVTKPIGVTELTEAVARIGMYWLLVNRTP